jgi:predicted transport protein
MKQLLSLFLFLLPCLAWAQYPSNGNQKITLGEQTTADGLIYRGVLADTGIITPSSDTSAYIILDTVNHRFYNYNRATNVWSMAGVGSISSGLTGVLPLLNGGTGQTAFINKAVPYSNGTILISDTSNLSVNTTGGKVRINNIDIGKSTGTITGNLIFGNGNLQKNTTGNTNLAFGNGALFNNTTGTENVGIGSNALDANTTGQFNIAVGSQSLSKNTTSLRNIAIGRTALEDHKTGDDNIGIGYLTLANDTISSFNLAVGNNAMSAIVGSASNNTSIGHGTMLLKTSGTGNVALGHYAGYLNTTGSNNIWIGEVFTGSSNTASNEATVGNSSTATYRIFQSAWTNVSDIRDKTDILPLNYGMNFIDKLKPVSFVWDMRDGGKIGIEEIGFIAQDLQQAQIDLGINIPNLVNSDNENQLGVAAGNLIPIIIKALQEANEKIKLLEQKIINLENK